MFVLSLLVACGGEPAAPSKAPAAPTPAPAAAPAPAAPAAPVGPDGPTSIALPAGFPTSKAELPTDEATLKKGEEVYSAKGCAGCHKFGAKLVGPDLVGVADRRSVPWIGRMILKPEVMIKEDPVAKQLFAETMTPMANQGIPETDIVPLIAWMAQQKAP